MDRRMQKDPLPNGRQARLHKQNRDDRSFCAANKLKTKPMTNG